MAEVESDEEIAASRSMWQKIAQRVHDGQMPPMDAEPLSLEDRTWLSDTIPGIFRKVAAARGPQPGPYRLRRLNRSQLSNSIRDLLGVHYDAAHALPVDGAGGEGFDNAAETLTLSPIHVEKYLDLAHESLQYASANETSRRMLLHLESSSDADEDQRATEVLRRFADRAYRRPATDDEIAKLLQLFRSGRNDRAMSWDESIWFAMRACLVSPHFLMIIEQPAKYPEHVALSPFELATRLSYFLWDSMPDRELRRAAEDGSLVTPEVLEAQVLRMIRDDKLSNMLHSFVGQWLSTRDLGRGHKLDESLFPEMHDEMADTLRSEPVRFFEWMLRENRSLLELLDSRTIFINEYSIRVYGISRKGIDLNQNLKRIELPEDHVRGGLVTMGGVLAISSHATRTSPVLRGKWILDKILNTPPPPPPPNVPPLEESAHDEEAKTLRQQLERHRSDATCASCHNLLDPLGFGLEEFDPMGRFRTEDHGEPIDCTGQLPTGEKFSGARGLKQILLQRKDQFIRNVATRMFAFAVGRSLVDSDYGEIDRIADAVIADDYRSQRLILEIVRSVPFQHRGWMEESP